jgi:hypothetical protein
MTVSALIVNPGKSFLDEFAVQCRTHFGMTSSYTRYERPFDDEHPRLRPGRDPSFQLVVIDLEDWATDEDPINILNNRLPAWVKAVIEDADPQACIVILCPDRAMPAVRQMVLALEREPEPIVCPRSYGQLVQMTITEVIYREWTIWEKWRASTEGPPTDDGPGDSRGGMWDRGFWGR